MGQYDSAIQLLIKAQDQTGPAFASLQGNLKKTGDATGVAGIATSIFSGVAVAGLISGLQTAGRMANEQEQSLVRLATAVDNNGGSWAANEKQIMASIDANKRFGFSGNELADSLNTLTITSGSWEEALARQKGAMDLARATGADLAITSKYLGKVTDDNVTALARLGIVVRAGATAEELLAEVRKRTGDAAEKQAKTGAVQAQILKNTIDDMYAAVGAQSAVFTTLSGAGMILPKTFGLAAGAITFFTKATTTGAVSSTAFARSLGSLGSAGMALGRVLGPAGVIAIGAYATVNALHSLFRNFSAPGSEGEKVATTMDQFAAISEKHGGGIGGFFGTIKDIYMETNADTVLGRFLKGQDEAKTKQDAITNAAKITLSTYKDLTDSQRKTLDLIGGPSGATTAKTSQATALTALTGIFGTEEQIPASLVKTIKGITTNTMGLTGAALRKELGDQIYKLVEDVVSGPAIKDFEDQIASFKKDPAALAVAAKEAGKSTMEFMATLALELKRARDNAKILSEELGVALRGADLEPQDAKKLKTTSDLIRKVHEAKDAIAEIEPIHNKDLRRMLEINLAWGDSIIGAKTYGYVLSQLPTPPRPPLWPASDYIVSGQQRQDALTGRGPFDSGPRALGGVMWPGNVYSLGEQNRREAVVMGVGSDRSRDGGGGVTIAPGAISLHYSGPADKPAAARLGADIVDTVTEALRQQTRRVGRRPSPFGAV